MNDVEYLISLDYLKKQVDRELRRVRPDVERHFRERMESGETNGQGRPSYGYWVDGDKLASFWFQARKGEPAHVERTIGIHDYDALLADDNPDFAAWLKRKIHNQLFDLAKEYATETGDLLDGMCVIEEEVPEVPTTYDGFRFRTNERKLAQRIGPQLPSVVAGLIEEERK